MCIIWLSLKIVITSIKYNFLLIKLLLSMIYLLKAEFSINKSLFRVFKCLRWITVMERYVSILFMHRFVISILSVGKDYFIISFLIELKLYINFYKARVLYCLIVDDWDVEIISKAWYIFKKIVKAKSKNKMISICLNNISVKMYNNVIHKNYTLLYNI